MTIGNLAIGWDNLASVGTVTAEDEVATLPATNVQTDDVQEIWRAADATTPAIKCDLGAQVSIQAVALVNCNVPAADQVKVLLSTSDPTGAAGDAYNSGNITSGTDPSTRLYIHLMAAPHTGRYLRVQWPSPSVVPEVGRLFAGPIWYPSHNPDFGWQQMTRDYSRRTITLGQRIIVDIGLRQRGYKGAIEALTATEDDTQILGINRVCGQHRDLLICWDRDGTDAAKSRRALWGLLENPIPHPNTSYARYSAELEVWERL